MRRQGERGGFFHSGPQQVKAIGQTSRDSKQLRASTSALMSSTREFLHRQANAGSKNREVNRVPPTSYTSSYPIDTVARNQRGHSLFLTK